MRIVPYWRRLPRLASVQLIALIPIIAGLREAIPALQAVLSPDRFAQLNALIAVCAVIARGIQQPKATGNDSDQR